MKALSGFLLITLACLAAGCAPEQEQAPSVDLQAERAAAAAVVDAFGEIFVTEDMAAVERIFADDPDMVIIGTDAAEYWTGFEPMRASYEAQFEAYDESTVECRDQDVKVHASGEVAWFSERCDIQVTTGGEQVSVEGMRFSGVMEKRGADWVIVQFHGSVPVQGQAVEY